MVAVHQVQKPRQQLLALLVCQSIDVLDVPPHREDALPPRHRVGPHHRVDRLELFAYVLGGSARLVVQLESGTLRDLVEVRLLERGSQSLEELLVRLGEAVVDLITRRP